MTYEHSLLYLCLGVECKKYIAVDEGTRNKVEPDRPKKHLTI